jgi:hypothetical protein
MNPSTEEIEKIEKDVKCLISLIVIDFMKELKQKPNSTLITVRCCDEFFRHVNYKTQEFIKKLEKTLKNSTTVGVSRICYRFETEFYNEEDSKSLGHVFDFYIANQEQHENKKECVSPYGSDKLKLMEEMHRIIEESDEDVAVSFCPSDGGFIHVTSCNGPSHIDYNSF